ncbi:MAG: histone deacetylase [Armatimonadetes bacterium]|nr:histone deacetylase [Armatimonadota bacterium]
MTRPAILYSPAYRADIGSHVFPMEKYAALAGRLRRDGTGDGFEWLEPAPAERADLALVHTEKYLDSFYSLRMDSHTWDSEIPLTSELRDAFLLMTGGTVQASRLALESGVAVNLGGGFHHAMPDRAEGFCYVNDLAVATRVLMRDRLVQRALVVDCDLHQGNGTARIFGGDSDVYTFSIHQEDLYPMKETSTMDIGLRNFVRDAEYLDLLAGALNRIFSNFTPHIVLYQAGADPFEGDQLGSLRVTKKGLETRDRMVLEACAARKVPLAVTLGGGYAADFNDTVEIHANTVRGAADFHG